MGLVFDQADLFTLSLTHRSMGAKNNERLEYLGDSILGFVIAEKLYQMFPNASEGDLSRLRASLVNQTSLAELAMPMIGRSRSSSVRPIAFKSERCGALSGPFFIISERIFPPFWSFSPRFARDKFSHTTYIRSAL